MLFITLWQGINIDIGFLPLALATALKALEILSRIRGNNADENAPQDMEGLEGRICAAMQVIGKDKMYELFMSTFPEDFDEDYEEPEEEYAEEEATDVTD